MAEITPVMAAAADEYVRQNLDLAQTLGVHARRSCHGGFHFSSDVRGAIRRPRIERLRLAVRLAEERGHRAPLREPQRRARARRDPLHPAHVAETRRFFEAVSSPQLRWACNVGHAMLVPDGFDGFLDGVRRRHHRPRPPARHQWPSTRSTSYPGDGIVDFRHVFTALHRAGLSRPFTLDFGAPDEKAHWRDRWAALLDEIAAAEG